MVVCEVPAYPVSAKIPCSTGKIQGISSKTPIFGEIVTWKVIECQPVGVEIPCTGEQEINLSLQGIYPHKQGKKSIWQGKAMVVHIPRSPQQASPLR